MHPNPAFRQDERDALLAEAHRIGFAHVFAAAPDGPMVVHAPLTRHGNRVRFHVARGNRIAPHLAGAQLLISLAAPESYVSSNWYANRANQVPTWNYVAVELEGVATELDPAGTLEQLDALAAEHEPRVNPADPWHRHKVDPAFLDRLLAAIRGYELEVTAARGTTKLSQNKPDADRRGAVAGLRALADRMERA